MWALEDLYAFLISITERSKCKVSDKDFEIFITAQLRKQSWPRN